MTFTIEASLFGSLSKADAPSHIMQPLNIFSRLILFGLNPYNQLHDQYDSIVRQQA